MRVCQCYYDIVTMKRIFSIYLHAFNGQSVGQSMTLATLINPFFKKLITILVKLVLCFNKLKL